MMIGCPFRREDFRSFFHHLILFTLFVVVPLAAFEGRAMGRNDDDFLAPTHVQLAKPPPLFNPRTFPSSCDFGLLGSLKDKLVEKGHSPPEELFPEVDHF
jgi:hypothetical protein